MIPDPFIRDGGGADALVEGYYALRSARGLRSDVPVRIWFGAPLDTETGEELDRSPRWQIMVGGHLLETEPLRFAGIRIDEITAIWPACARCTITEDEYRFLIARGRWAAEHDPNDALAAYGRRIDPMTVTLP